MFYLYAKNLSHGDIRGHNIFIEDGEVDDTYKIFDPTITGLRN